MSRDKHEFQFIASVIAAAATVEGQYHRDRMEFWSGEYDKAGATVKATAKVDFKTYPVTGGERVDVVVNYGDPAAYTRMQEAFGKIAAHRKEAEQFETEATVYGTQGDRSYELSSLDVHYFRLGGDARPA